MQLDVGDENDKTEQSDDTSWVDDCECSDRSSCKARGFSTRKRDIERNKLYDILLVGWPIIDCNEISVDNWR